VPTEPRDDEPVAETADSEPKTATLADLMERPLPESTLPIDTVNGPAVLRLRAIRAPAFEALMAAHPSKAMFERWNAEGFEPALVAACLQEPLLSEREAAQVRDQWPHGDWMQLFGAAIDLCDRSRLGEPFAG
jgi:hypothetical protein